MAKNSPALRVLVVEDEPLIRWSLAEMLAGAGHVVSDAADGASAMEAVINAQHTFDVVLVDVRLPDSDDLTLVSQIRRASPASAVVLMTAFGTPEMVRDAHELGVRQILDKPFDMTGINNVVRAATTTT